ncbi:unnamed protein product [Oikopleura dioica]|uniref:Beta-1,4-galactosyltransferase n=1 Tax=Oikopleura dioica TaxID=34765 RepID=E4XGL8_OIKDI|nr:unnamed protein product [Oikopleura dioica]
MVPEDDRNIYLCQNEPTHLSPFIDKFGYRSHYGTDWGGVTMIRPEQYSKANGYSNMFWGWGREDSDMEWRLNAKGIKAIRPINEVNARFSMIPHEHPWRFQNEKFNLGSAAKMTTKEKLMMTKRERSSWDGVNNAKFRLDHVVYDKLFTKLLIDIRRFEVEELQVVIDQGQFLNPIFYQRDILQSISKLSQKKMKINQTKGECHFKTFNNTYLDPNFRMKIGEDRSGYFAEAVAEAHCNDAGQACAGIIRDRGAASADGRDWILREKAILLTPDEYRFTTGKGHSSGVPANLLTKMKICQGQMSNVYPFLSTAKNAVYKSRMRLKFLLPLTTSLIYRDIVLFEGWPTGFSHEYPVEIRPEETRENLSFSFQTGEFTLPTYSGWYTVQAKISDRFDQTWFEWSFQFRVDENSQEAASKRLQYLQEIKEKLAKYKEESKSGHEHIKEKRALMEAFSHGKDIR